MQMNRLTGLLMLFGLFCFIGLSDFVWAEGQGEVRRAVQAGKLKPLAEILQKLQTRHPGRVVDVDFERDAEGRRWYEVTLQKADGSKQKLYLDAATGESIVSPRPLLQESLPMSAILRGILSRYPGSILEAELELDSSHVPAYKVHLMMRDGREQTLWVNALTGETLHSHQLTPRIADGLRSVPDVLENLESRYEGRATEVELKRSCQGRLYYEVEFDLANGHDVDVRVDARTGQILSESEWMCGS